MPATPAARAAPGSGPVEFEPGSFRDRSNRVFLRGGRVFRALDAAAWEHWSTLSTTAFFSRGVNEGTIVATRELRPEESPFDKAGPWRSVLEHAAIPLVSYPYEWCFGMLRAAALQQLDLLASALSEGVTLQDGTPFNVQFRGVRPVFIDIGSFRRHDPPGPWAGYRQFCQQQLFPLMLQAHRGVDFQPWLRGRLEGLSPQTFSAMLSLRDWFRRGVLTHVVLHAALSRRGDSADVSIERQLRATGFDRSIVQANVHKLQGLVSRLRWRPAATLWSQYDAEAAPVQRDSAAKEEFVHRTAASGAWKLAWDLGCNLGRYSRIAAKHAELVVAIDSDHVTVERLYEALVAEDERRILPLVGNIADASPGLGWRGAERPDLLTRGRPELVLCLALLHHLVIGENLPLADFLDWLADLGGRAVVEFVEKRDPQVQSMLRNRADQFSDYRIESFEQLVTERFHVVRREVLPSGTRHLFDLEPRR